MVRGAGGLGPPPGSAWEVAAATPDPELPQLTIGELGILRDVEQRGEHVRATITPTYSGCPAVRDIMLDLRHRLQEAGYRHVEVQTQLAPPWTTDWITAEGRRKLTVAGIAPPAPAAAPAPAHTGPVPIVLQPTAPVRCPQCGSAETIELAHFAGTACKALRRCRQCGEPFEAVKPR